MQMQEFILEEEEEEISLRGLIQGNSEKYYICNEIFSDADCKQYSAIKILPRPNSQNQIQVDEHKFAIRCYDKNWIINKVLDQKKGGLQQPLEKHPKFFECFKQKFEESRQKVHPHIQQMKEYIEKDENYIFIVTEFCDLTLLDYFLSVKEEYGAKNIKIEIQMRKIFYQVFSALFDIYESHSMSFGGLLNPRDIMLVEKEGGELIVKFPHPFLASFQTILKFFNPENFPYFLAPEMIENLNNIRSHRDFLKKDSFDFSSLFRFHKDAGSKYDIYAVAFMVYELFFGCTPFRQDYKVRDSTSIIRYLNNNPPSYCIYTRAITKQFIKIIDKGLKFETSQRMDFKEFKLIIEELDPEKEGKDLDKRIDGILKEYDNLNIDTEMWGNFDNEKVDQKLRMFLDEKSRDNHTTRK